MPFIPNEINKSILGCHSQEHTPPTMMLFPAQGGIWICPLCGEKTIIPARPTC